MKITISKAQPAADTRVMWNPVMAEKGGYRHFMLKEIYEQPRAIRHHPGQIFAETGTIHLEEIGLAREQLRKVRKYSSSPAARRGTRRWSASTCSRSSPHPDRGRYRVRIPLPQPAGRQGRPVHRHHPVRRDRRHARRPCARPRSAGAKVLAICNVVGSTASPRGRRRDLYPCRARDRRGLDQGLYRPARGALPLRRSISGRLRGKLSRRG